MVRDKTGGREVELLIPFDLNVGKGRIDRVTFSAWRLEHTLRFEEGAWSKPGVRSMPTLVAMMAELAGVDESTIKQLRYPDADRVMQAFLQMVPPEIAQSLSGLQQMPPPVEDLSGPAPVEDGERVPVPEPVPAQQTMDLSDG